MNWKKVILEKDGFPVKVYVNEKDSRAIMFPLFGKYFSFNSDVSALDLAVQIIFHVQREDGNPQNIFSFSSYENSKEDTLVIYQEAA